MTKQRSLFGDDVPDDLKSGRQQRDENLDRVGENAGDEWKKKALSVVHSLRFREVSGEDIRRACVNAGVEPHHSNAWGGFVAGLVKSGALEKTGRYTQMTSPNSHARETKLYLVR